MVTRQNRNQDRYRRIRSAILTGSLLSFLPLFILMKSAAGDASTTADLSTAAQAVAVAASPTETTSSQDAATQASASTASTSTSTKASSATTYTRTKAS